MENVCRIMVARRIVYFTSKNHLSLLSIGCGHCQYWASTALNFGHPVHEVLKLPADLGNSVSTQAKLEADECPSPEHDATLSVSRWTGR